MDKDNNEAKFNIEGNPGSGNTFIHIGTAYNVNPNATTVSNTFHITTGADGESVLQEVNGEKPGKKPANTNAALGIENGEPTLL